MSVNKVILVGISGRIRRCGSRAAGVRYASSRSQPARRGTTPRGTSKSAPSGTNVVVWGKQGENCGQYLSKGRQVYVEGAIRFPQATTTRTATSAYMTEIIALTVRFLGGGTGRGAGAGAGAPPLPDEMPVGPSSSTDEDIPF